jgi:hypothetical protein
MELKAPVGGMEDRRREMSESESAPPPSASSPTPEEIRQRAYELHLERGCIHGCDLDDWHQAERELRRSINQSIVH